MALMSVGLELVMPEDPQPSRAVYESVNKLLKILPDSDKGEVIPEWLLGSRDWKLGFRRRSDEHIRDLFAVFIDHMEELVRQGRLERNVTYKRAINFVQELEKRREALATSDASAR